MKETNLKGNKTKAVKFSTVEKTVSPTTRRKISENKNSDMLIKDILDLKTDLSELKKILTKMEQETGVS